MNRIAIPLFYALPIWVFLAVVGVSASMADAGALSAKQGGLAFASLFFGFVSAIPTALIAAQRPDVRPLPKETRRAFGLGVGGVFAIAMTYIFAQAFPFPAVSVLVGVVVVFGVLLGIPLYLQSRSTRTTPPQ